MLEINYMNIGEIIPYENNPRHNDQAVEMVAKSIKEFGFKNPIIIDKDKVIIAGHTRLRAAEKLGLKKIPVIKAEDLTPEQVRAYRIADNKTTELAEWDFELLAQELDQLDLEGFDLSLTGFNRDEIGDILSLEDERIEVIEDDYVIEEPEKPISRQGDIWELGNHRLMCGDSTDKKDVETLMNGEMADLLLTDPPYNVGYEGKDGMTIQNDDMGDKAFREFILEANKRMFEIAKEGTPIYIFHSDAGGDIFRKALMDAGFALKQVLIWVKNSLVLGRQDYHWKHEPILYGWKEGAAHKWYGGRTKDTVIEDKLDISKLSKKELQDLVKALQDDREHTTIIRADKPISSDLHPTMKPIKVLGYLIKNSSLKRDIVVDLFGGSGSTLIASEQLVRTCYTMELDERYTDVIVDRYINFKGSSDDVFLIRDGHKTPYQKI